MVKSRSPLLAFILSLFVMGLGQVYARRGRRAIIILLVGVLIYMLFQWTHALTYYYGALAEIAVLLLYSLYQAVDAWKVASHQERVSLKMYNRWYVYAFYIIMVINLFIFLSMHYGNYRIYKITSSSMEPTLQIGEIIVVKYPYQFDNQGSRGDLVTIDTTGLREIDDEDVPDGIYLRRIIAVPGDSYARRNDKSKLNSELIEETYIEVDNEKNKDSRFITAKDIAEGHVYVLGDNRDFSYDSRTLGPVPLDNITGEAMYVLWSKNQNRMGKSLRHDPPSTSEDKVSATSE